MKKPIVLCIMDGIGVGEDSQTNACFIARTPMLDYLKATYPKSLLKASGSDVGLPEGQMGNSEVGHLNIGAGRIVYQSLTMINQAITDNHFQTNKAFIDVINHAKVKKKKLHLMGLLSDGGVHSHINHLKKLIQMANEQGVTDVYLHIFMDGRDVLPDSGAAFLDDLIAYAKKNGCAQIASISGRYYAMDRDKRFERNFLAYQAMVLHSGPSFEDAKTYLKESYKQGVLDEFVIPAYNNQIDGAIGDEDSLICINFRPDRSIQIAALLTNENYVEVFEKQPKNLSFVAMMAYDQEVKADIAFQHEELHNVLGVHLANEGYQQLRIAETEKYAHVTFFMDGQVKYDGYDKPELLGCKRILIESPKVLTYDLQPEMSAYKVKDALIKELNKKYLDVVLLNFANGDMVGHTGNIAASIKAVEVVDQCIADIYQVVSKIGGTMLITADHGNCEQMRDQDDNTFTAHTLNKVDFIVTKQGIELNDGRLSDIAPTILALLKSEKPVEMTGHSLIK